MFLHIAGWLASKARCSPCSIRLLFERSPTPSRGDDKPLVKELLASVKQMREATKNQSGQVRFSKQELQDPSHVAIERLVPLRRGKWRLMPPGVEADE